MNESSRFGRYEVKSVLGEGQMGIVYMATDPLIGRPVAIKAIREDPGQLSGGFAECRARFEREIQIAGTFAHPNIVTIYDVGLEEGQSFVAMECVEGGSLADLLGRERTLPFEKVIDLVEQIGSALDYAHARGVVHRDIKPPNILLTFDGRPKVTDFGVARLSDSTLTRHGATYGSPAYMSPEQAASQAIGGTSDQFSLAILTYRMLTGELPFAGDSVNAVMYRIVKEEPVPPGLLNPLLPDEASAVLLRALAKNPLDRFRSCRELASALREALESAAAAETAALRQDALAAEVFCRGPDRGESEDGPAGVDALEPTHAVGPRKGYLATVTGLFGSSLAATLSISDESRVWQYVTGAVLLVLAVLVGANILLSESGAEGRPPREQVFRVLQKEASASQAALGSALLVVPTAEESRGKEDGIAPSWLSRPLSDGPAEPVHLASVPPAPSVTEPPRSQNFSEPEASGRRVDRGAAGPGTSRESSGESTGDSTGDSEREISVDGEPVIEGLIESGEAEGDGTAPIYEVAEGSAGARLEDREEEGPPSEWKMVPAGSIPNDLGRRSYSAAAAFRTIMGGLEGGVPDTLLNETTCVAVLPSVVKVGFVVGGRSGKGLMSCRTGWGWSRPAFVSISGGSIGLQIGAQATDFVLLFGSGMAIERLAHGPFELGSDGASVATGPVDKKEEAIARLEGRPEIYSYSHSRGLFAGVSLEGSTLFLDHEANSTVYGTIFARAEPLSSYGGELQRELSSLLDELGRYDR